MQALFDSGHAIDIVILVIVIEAIWLRLRGHALRNLATMLLPGALILLGLRFALTGADWPWIAGPLLLSLPVHLAEVARQDRVNSSAVK